MLKMTRRLFFGALGLAGIAAVPNAVAVEKNPNNTENPKNLPVVIFNKDGCVVNCRELMKDIPFTADANTKHFSISHKRMIRVWVREQDAFICELWACPEGFQRCHHWGEVELMEEQSPGINSEPARWTYGKLLAIDESYCKATRHARWTTVEN